jgi:hypothetical protein
VIYLTDITVRLQLHSDVPVLKYSIHFCFIFDNMNVAFDAFFLKKCIK